jgi:hypothetical protein
MVPPIRWLMRSLHPKVGKISDKSVSNAMLANAYKLSDGDDF